MATVIEGWINLDKPAGISSAKAVTYIKRMLPRGTKIGHAGTLDPFATGILIVLIGKATRMCEQFMGRAKQYETTIRLGATTQTLDPTSPEVPWLDARPVERETIESLLPQFVGEIQQRPPAYSAMKVDGLRAYRLAREGRPPELPARPVTIHELSLLDYAWPLLSLRIDCGKGTYIRSLARDIGAALGSAGYLLKLRRTRVGEVDIGDAVTLEQLQADSVAAHLYPPS